MADDGPPLIRRVLHQIWMQDRRGVPAKYDAARQSWQHLHPTWTIIVWDEDSIRELIMERLGWSWLVWYSNIKRMISRADVGRCIILWLEGGLYADMDCHAIQSLEGLLQRAERKARGRCLLMCRKHNNAVIAASAGNPFFADIWFPQVKLALQHAGFSWLKRVWVRHCMAADVSETTGPAMWGRALATVTTGPTSITPTTAGPSPTPPDPYGIFLAEAHELYPLPMSKKMMSLTPQVVEQLRAQGAYTYHASDNSWLKGGWEYWGFRLGDEAGRRQMAQILFVALLIVGVLVGWRRMEKK